MDPPRACCTVCCLVPAFRGGALACALHGVDATLTHAAATLAMARGVRALSSRVATAVAAFTTVGAANRARAAAYIRRHPASQPQFVPPSLATPLPSSSSSLTDAPYKCVPAVSGAPPSPPQLAAFMERQYGALDAVVLDVRADATFADWMLVCSALGTSHVRAVAHGVQRHLTADGVRVGNEPVSLVGAADDDWIVVDVGTLVVHVMTPEMRKLYALELLWAPRAPLEC
ncbi:unnamed protein product [Agarophyton chilense]